MKNSHVENDETISVVAALIYREGRILACQRREDGAYPLKWEFPGGKVEPGESLLDALRRELKEELDIQMRGAVEVFRHRHTYAASLRVDVRFFRVESYSGEMKNRIFRRIVWVDVQGLADLDFLDGDLPLIRKLAACEGSESIA